MMVSAVHTSHPHGQEGAPYPSMGHMRMTALVLSEVPSVPGTHPLLKT